MDQITATIIREAKPVKLFKYLIEHAFEITERRPGIYTVTGNIMFPTQIVVGRELDPERNPWLHLTSSSVTEADMRKALVYADSVTDKREQDLLDSILDLCMSANPDIVKTIKESADMYKVVRDLFQEEIDAVQKESDQRIAQVQQENQRLQAEIHRLTKATV